MRVIRVLINMNYHVSENTKLITLRIKVSFVFLGKLCCEHMVINYNFFNNFFESKNQ